MGNSMFIVFLFCSLLVSRLSAFSAIEKVISLNISVRSIEPIDMRGVNLNKASEILPDSQCAGSTIIHQEIGRCGDNLPDVYVIPHLAILHDGVRCGTGLPTEYTILVAGKFLTDARTAFAAELGPLYGLLSSNARAINAFNVLHNIEPVHLGFEFTAPRICGGRVHYEQNTIYIFLRPTPESRDLNFGFAYLGVSERGMVTIKDDEQLCLYKESRNLGPGQPEYSTPTPSPLGIISLPSNFVTAASFSDPPSMPTCFPARSIVSPSPSPSSTPPPSPTPSQTSTPSATPSGTALPTVTPSQTQPQQSPTPATTLAPTTVVIISGSPTSSPSSSLQVSPIASVTASASPVPTSSPSPVAPSPSMTESPSGNVTQPSMSAGPSSSPPQITSSPAIPPAVPSPTSSGRPSPSQGSPSPATQISPTTTMTPSQEPAESPSTSPGGTSVPPNQSPDTPSVPASPQVTPPTNSPTTSTAPIRPSASFSPSSSPIRSAVVTGGSQVPVPSMSSTSTATPPNISPTVAASGSNRPTLSSGPSASTAASASANPSPSNTSNGLATPSASTAGTTPVAPSGDASISSTATPSVGPSGPSPISSSTPVLSSTSASPSNTSNPTSAPASASGVTASMSPSASNSSPASGTPSASSTMAAANASSSATSALSNSPSRSPLAEDDGSVCFPSSATVELDSGRQVRISMLTVGDRVKVGHESYSEVFMFTHHTTNVVSTFIRVSVDSGESIALSPSHYIPISGRLKTARMVAIGDVVWLGNGRTAAVICVERVTMGGLHNPQTLDGRIVVDGVVASTFTESVAPVSAVSILAPIRVLYSLGVLRHTIGQLLASRGHSLAALLPSGRPIW